MKFTRGTVLCARHSGAISRSLCVKAISQCRVLRGHQAKEDTLERSLSVILPVQNVEKTLRAYVESLLEYLPDLTGRFEILIVDDGSTDHTEDIAYEIVRMYPQVSFIAHATSKGNAAAVQTGMSNTKGEIVFVGDARASFQAADIQKLWNLRNDDRLVMARTHAQPKPLDDSLIQRLVAWGEAVRKSNQTSRPGVQMIRRPAIESLAAMQQPENELTVDHTADADTIRLGNLPTTTPASSFIYS